jgi:hypothetical protein
VDSPAPPAPSPPLLSRDDVPGYLASVGPMAKTDEACARHALSCLRSLWNAEVQSPAGAPGDAVGASPAPEPPSPAATPSLAHDMVGWVEEVVTAHPHSSAVLQLALGLLDAVCEATKGSHHVVDVCAGRALAATLPLHSVEGPSRARWQDAWVQTAACWLVERCARLSGVAMSLSVLRLLKAVTSALRVHGRDPGVQEAGLAALAALIKRCLQVGACACGYACVRVRVRVHVH